MSVVLEKAWAIQQFEGRRIGTRHLATVEVHGRRVVGVCAVNGLEGVSVGGVDLKGLAGEGVQVIDRIAPHVVARRVEERVGRLVATARRRQRRRRETYRCDQFLHQTIESTS